MHPHITQRSANRVQVRLPLWLDVLTVARFDFASKWAVTDYNVPCQHTNRQLRIRHAWDIFVLDYWIVSMRHVVRIGGNDYEGESLEILISTP
jgi:hypothetical protein